MQKRTIYVMIVAIVVLFSFNTDYISAQSVSDLDSKIQDLERKQSNLNKKKQEISREKQNVTQKKDANLKEQGNVQQQLDRIQSELASTQAEIQSVEASIASTQKEITELESEIKLLNEEIKELEDRIEKRNELLKERLRSIQERGGKARFLSVLLGAQNFTDFISRTTAVNTIMNQDREIMEEHQADQIALKNKKIEVEKKKEDVENKKSQLEAEKASLDQLKAQLDEQKAEQDRLLKELKKEYAVLEEHELTLEEEQELIAAEAAVIEKAKQIALEEKRKLEEQARQQQQAAVTNNSQQKQVVKVSNSGYIRPVAGYISSEYGWRVHPISKQRKFHNGIDIAGNNGLEVMAANSGVVAYAGWRGGYGNTVMISHGSVTTLYAHLSSISVSAGQVVKRGQVIGRVGSTGNSTGPHLHFEVHPNGYGNGTANPRQYVNF